jgi:hypothetical protein
MRKPTEPANKLILSRSELTQLVYDKLQIIGGEVEEIQQDEHKATPARLADMKARLRRIGIEAKRAASLIETHEPLAKAGHCLHCGKPYAEHDDEPRPRAPDEPRIRVKGDPEAPPRCRALKAYFESLEIETYAPLDLAEAQ